MSKIRIKLEENNDNLDLLHAMGSRKKLESFEAQETFAVLAGPVVQEVLNQAGTSVGIWRDMPMGFDDPSTLPIDPLRDVADDHLTIWSQEVPGGLATNLVTGLEEIKFNTYTLTSAISWYKRWAARGRLDLVSKWLERLAQTILQKQDYNSWAAILSVLAQADTNGQKHVIKSKFTGKNFTLEDLNNLLVLNDRIYSSYQGGTPVGGAGSVTDLYFGPEVMAQIRAMSFNPISTRGGFNSAGAENTGGTSLGLPDAMRSKFFSAGGQAELWDINLHKILEFGPGKNYTTIFDVAAGSTQYEVYGGGSGEVFDAADDLVVGLDLSADAFLRPVVRDGENGSTFTLEADNQFLQRSDKIGYYGSVEEGRLILDDRALVGIILNNAN